METHGIDFRFQILKEGVNVPGSPKRAEGKFCYLIETGYGHFWICDGQMSDPEIIAHVKRELTASWEFAQKQKPHLCQRRGMFGTGVMMCPIDNCVHGHCDICARMRSKAHKEGKL